MHIKKITLRNFRCFQELEIDLHPRLTVLVAENGGGKTSILDGIAIGLSPVLRHLSSAGQRLTGPGITDKDFRLVPWAGRGGEDRWGASDYAQIVIETLKGMKWDHWRASTKHKQPESKIGQSELVGYTSKILESLKSETPDLLPVFAYFGARRGWLEVPERLWETKVDYSQPTSALFGALDSLSNFKEMLKWFDAEEAAELRANKNCSKKDYKESISLEVVKSTVSSILGGTYKNPHFNYRHKFVVEGPEAPGVLQVTQLSQGYQSMMALGMDFARRLALGNAHLYGLGADFDWSFADDYLRDWNPEHFDNLPPRGPSWAPAVMLVDEIDLHLHPSWQQRVLQDLMRAFPGTQFIVTSHSPQVISTVPMECIRIIKDGRIYAAPPGTDGAEAQRILEDVFHVRSRPDTEKARNLDEYLRLVDERQWESPRALELRRKLDDWSKGQEPRLLDADLQIENMKWEQGE